MKKALFKTNPLENLLRRNSIIMIAQAGLRVTPRRKVPKGNFTFFLSRKNR